MKYTIYKVALAFMSVSFLFADSSFTKKRSESASTIREHCCSELDEIITQIPKILRLEADIQEMSAHLLRECIEGQKKAWLLSASKEQLQQMRILVKEMRTASDLFIATQQERIKQMAALYRDVCKGA